MDRFWVAQDGHFVLDDEGFLADPEGKSGRFHGRRALIRDHDTVCATMSAVRVVLDTNVLVSAFRSREGVAFRLITLLREGRFEISVSVPLVLEYEDVLLRARNLGEEDVLTTLRFLCSVANRQKIFFLWRPSLPDPKDDMVLEVAVASRARYIVTYNGKDFAAARRFGIEAVTPRAFLEFLGG